LAVTVICLLLNVWGRHILYEDRVSLDSYSGEIPFATISDFAGPGSSDYRNTMSGVMVGSVNTVMEWSDWLAPRCIDFNEHAQITLSDGNVLKGGLYVEYFETVSPWVARLIAKDYNRIDRLKRGYEPIDAPNLNADFVTAYYSKLHFPVILIQKDNIVVRAFFYQTSESYMMELEDWAGIMAESISRN